MFQDAQGKIKAGREARQRVISAANRYGMPEFASIMKAAQAIRDGGHGFSDKAREEANEALRLFPKGNVRGVAALALAQIGDAAKAKKLMDEEARDFPDDTLRQSVYGPGVVGLMDLAQNKPADAIAALEPSRKYELSGQGPGLNFRPLHIRGLAHMQLHDGVKAAVEFQKILDHRAGGSAGPLYNRSHLSIARAYLLQGESAKARTAYQDFFAAWKDADADIPILIAAKSEYAKLH